MMDEQRLREIEAQLRDAGISTHWVGCETTHTHCAIRVLIAEVRRLQQANEDDTVLLGTVAAERDAALATAQAERNDAHDALIIEKGLTQLLHADITRLQQQRDAAIAERNTANYRADANWRRVGELEAERDQARRDVSMRDQLAEIDMGRLREANTTLAEARRVLREVEWHPCHGDYDGATRYACPMCDCEDREHASDCALAAVLAQDTDA